ncbi:transposable element Tcb2 transposase [Trichonephila clavipes]|nr:transposable element Tcb2 transposase [Trichonephila clavipes]
MMEAGWSDRQVARQLGLSDCVVRRCWDQWIREMSFTRRPGFARLTSRREYRHIKPNLDTPRLDALTDDTLTDDTLTDDTLTQCFSNCGARPPGGAR